MDLYRLLKFGRDDGLAMGASLAQSRRALQKLLPGQTAMTAEMNGMEVLFTDLVELHFFEDRLVNLIVKVSGCRSRDELRISETGLGLTRTSSLGAVVRWLHLAGIDWHIYQPLSDGKVVTLMTQGGATVEFVAEASRIVINRIHLTAGFGINASPLHACPASHMPPQG